jgi:hypothetical protein
LLQKLSISSFADASAAADAVPASMSFAIDRLRDDLAALAK